MGTRSTLNTTLYICTDQGVSGPIQQNHGRASEQISEGNLHLKQRESRTNSTKHQRRQIHELNKFWNILRSNRENMPMLN
jgi:hypothetical protein